MEKPAEPRHQLQRDLLLAERTRREQIRGSIGVPVSAIALSVCAFSALATNLVLNRWQHPARRLRAASGSIRKRLATPAGVGQVLRPS